jgi:hypothetical protein
VSEFLQVRCGVHRFLVPSADIDSIEILKYVPARFGGRRAPRQWLLLNGRVLAGSNAPDAPEHGIALRPAERAPFDVRIVVDQVGALIHCAPAAIEPLPHAVARLRSFFSGVWREELSQEYLFCLRPRRELPVTGFVWRRRVRRAVMTIPPSIGDERAAT